MSDRDVEAAHWFARMRMSDAEADRAEFEAWRSDPDNAAAYASAEEDWLLAGSASSESIAVHRAPPKPERSALRWAVAAAVLLALSVGFSWTLLGQRGDEPVVAANQTGELVLEDGTRVALMDGAKIDQRFDANERRVILIGGRARFTVAHDASRPFRVEAAGSETTALGTIFEVDLRGAQPVVHLIKGLVEVRATAKAETPLRLRPGESATVAAEGTQILEAVVSQRPPTRSAAGEGGAASLLVADTLPLRAVLDRANRLNASKIEVADAAIAARPVSGRFDVSDAASLARKLAAALGLAVEERGGRYLLTAKINN